MHAQSDSLLQKRLALRTLRNPVSAHPDPEKIAITGGNCGIRRKNTVLRPRRWDYKSLRRPLKGRRDRSRGEDFGRRGGTSLFPGPSQKGRHAEPGCAGQKGTQQPSTNEKKEGTIFHSGETRTGTENRAGKDRIPQAAPARVVGNSL